MLTEATTTVDGALPGLSEPPRAVMWTVSEVAARDGVTKQAVSKKVRELVELGLTIERDTRGFVGRLNVVEYDRLRGRTDDPSKAQAPGRRPDQATAPAAQAKPPGEDESYKEALRTKTWHESERLRLDLEERRGTLVRVDAVTDAVVTCASSITAIVDRLPNAADDLVAAVSREGVYGVRVALKQLASKLRADIAEAMTGIAADAPKLETEDAEPLELSPS
jgi:hypothetical protein